MRRTIAIIMLSLLSAWLIWDRIDGDTPKSKADPLDAVVDSLAQSNRALEIWKDSALASVPDTLTIIKTETVYRVRDRFIEYYGKPDTVKVFECDSAQMVKANQNKVRLDSCRVAAKILTLQLNGCEKGNAILLDQRHKERRRVEILERLNDAKWWQVARKCKLRRMLRNA